MNTLSIQLFTPPSEKQSMACENGDIGVLSCLSCSAKDQHCTHKNEGMGGIVPLPGSSTVRFRDARTNWPKRLWSLLESYPTQNIKINFGMQ